MTILLLGILVGWRMECTKEPMEDLQRLQLWIALFPSLFACVCACARHCNAPPTPIPSPTAGHKAELKGGSWTLGWGLCVNVCKYKSPKGLGPEISEGLFKVKKMLLDLNKFTFSFHHHPFNLVLNNSQTLLWALFIYYFLSVNTHLLMNERLAS